MNPTGDNQAGSKSGSASRAVIIMGQSSGLGFETTPRRVLFTGYGRSGKDEAAQFCEAHLGLRYGGSFSWHAKEHVAAFLGVHPMTAWENRHKNRQVWYEQCNVLRKDDITILAKRALATGDICTGIRDKEELQAAVSQRLFNLIIWVDRPGTPVDPTVTYTSEDVVNAGGVILVNDSTLEHYHRTLTQFFLLLGESVRMSEYAQKLAIWVDP